MNIIAQAIIILIAPGAMAATEQVRRHSQSLEAESEKPAENAASTLEHDPTLRDRKSVV